MIASPMYLSMNPVMLTNHRPHFVQIGIDKPEILPGHHAFRKRGKGADIGEKDGHLLFHLITEPDIHDALSVQKFEKAAGHFA